MPRARPSEARRPSRSRASGPRGASPGRSASARAPSRAPSARPRHRLLGYRVRGDAADRAEDPRLVVPARRAAGPEALRGARARLRARPRDPHPRGSAARGRGQRPSAGRPRAEAQAEPRELVLALLSRPARDRAGACHLEAGGRDSGGPGLAPLPHRAQRVRGERARTRSCRSSSGSGWPRTSTRVRPTRCR